MRGSPRPSLAGPTRSPRLTARVLAVVLVAGLLAACQHPARYVLFIGNSYTAINGGLDKQLAGLSPATSTQQVTVGGYTLEQHWNAGQALPLIREGGWNFVVLQEQSQTPVFSADKFRSFARQFDKEIKAEGGQTVLLMTWERPDSAAAGVTTANLAAAYSAAGAELGARVAPAGLAFARSLRERPDLVLNGADGHPTLLGSYLAACVLYGTLFKQTPLGNPYADGSIPGDVRDYLQRIAAETLGY